MSRVTRRGFRDPLGPHVRIYHSMMKSPAWVALSSSGIRLFLDLRLKLTSFNNGDIEAVFSELRHRGWRSKTTLHRALRELQALGFIAQTRQGGIAAMSTICSLYRFTDQDSITSDKLDVSGMKTTNDFRKFESVRAAKAAVREAERLNSAYNADRSEKKKVQKPDFESPAAALAGAKIKSRKRTRRKKKSPKNAPVTTFERTG